MGQIISVVSGKGGTGKTTTCGAVGAALAALGKFVLCVDADTEMRNLDITLGLESFSPPGPVTVTVNDAFSPQRKRQSAWSVSTL